MHCRTTVVRLPKTVNVARTLLVVASALLFAAGCSDQVSQKDLNMGRRAAEELGQSQGSSAKQELPRSSAVTPAPDLYAGPGQAAQSAGEARDSSDPAAEDEEAASLGAALAATSGPVAEMSIPESRVDAEAKGQDVPPNGAAPRALSDEAGEAAPEEADARYVPTMAPPPPPATGGGPEGLGRYAGEEEAAPEEPQLPAMGGGGGDDARKHSSEEGWTDSWRRPEPTERPAIREEPPRDMYFQDYGVNPWVDTARDNLSTFAMDVDTGSYTLARNYLANRTMPPIEAIRVEEFVNYFEQGYEPPRRGAFAVHLDAAPSPWGANDEVYFRVGVKGREVSDYRRRDAVLTFVVDVSGSMEEGGRLELVKDSLMELVDQMGTGDEIGIVAYSNDAWVVLPTTSARNRREIDRAIARLYPTQSTNAEAGLDLGYELAEGAYRAEAINRVVLCSDGVANVGATGPAQILRRISPAVDRGITLTAVGVGMGNYNDVLLEQLADHGNGTYYYVDDRSEAHRVFIENLTGTLQVIARDAKVQVEFESESVAAYRLIGYENRDVADADFRDDSVDAGEIGSGHSVTAVYALKLHSGARGSLATARVRYLDPDELNPNETSKTIRTSEVAAAFNRAEPRFRVAVAAATFAEVLRDSYYTRDLPLANVARVAAAAAADLEYDADVEELEELIRTADGMDVAYGYYEGYP